MLDKLTVTTLVVEQLSRIGDSLLAARIQELLVEPNPVSRAWHYGAPREKFICWTVLEHRPSNTGIAYCEQGFGPTYPWGLVFLSGLYTSIGMDSAWFSSLEEAFRDSMAWDSPNPHGQESA
jgi:hypothetical protein